mmetsp:Transcript_56629/g.115954  ORF Transcript_56629/g.115954 Transcript_56629/m.115954 type:complete len:200 (+) Transcript_56629:5481-6080(+)
MCPSSPLKNSFTSAKLPVKAPSIMANFWFASTGLYNTVLMPLSRATASVIMGPTRVRMLSQTSLTWVCESSLTERRTSRWLTPSFFTNRSNSCANASRMPTLPSHSFRRAWMANSLGSTWSRICRKRSKPTLSYSSGSNGPRPLVGSSLFSRSSTVSTSCSRTSRCPATLAMARRSSRIPITPLPSASNSLNMVSAGSL